MSARAWRAGVLALCVACAPRPPAVASRPSPPAGLDAAARDAHDAPDDARDAGTAPDAARAPARDASPAASPLPRTPAEHLASLRLDDATFARRVLYSWTSPAQVAALAQTRVLLAYTASSPGARSPFNRLLDQLARRRDPDGALARLLLTDPVLERRRYAWHAPYATVLGAGSRTYGTELIRVELREEAWIARLDPTREHPFEVFDLAGRPVPVVEWTRTPRRIAAVYHLRTGAGEDAWFREYVLCSEPMVARWSVGTPEIAEELRAERALLAWIAPFARERVGPPGRTAHRVWRTGPTASSEGPAALRLAGAWQMTLAFDNARYTFRETNVNNALRALEGYTVAATLDARPPRAE